MLRVPIQKTLFQVQQIVLSCMMGYAIPMTVYAIFSILINMLYDNYNLVPFLAAILQYFIVER